MKNDGGQAFPYEQIMKKVDSEEMCGSIYNPGMTLRDYFAGQVIANRSNTDYEDMVEDSDGEITRFEAIARDAYDIADAMLKHKRKT